MRRIYKIAKAELFTLFYSPVAWFVLVIFTIQVGLKLTSLLSGFVYSEDMGFGNGFLTANLFGGMYGLYNTVQQYLYLYMPLLTMGLMSRELSSGTIKLLYSSPVTAAHIIVGKFFAMMIYGLILLGILIVYIVFSACVIENFNMAEALSGLLGIYLLLCAYSAIGLFVSCLTSYQVVAAIGTLVLLAVLNYMNQVWQSVEFVRDITYWLCLSGRTNEMISGLLCSEDILYFIIVTAMFLMLCVLKLQSTRIHLAASVVWGRYVGVVLAAMLLGYLTSRPQLMTYYDTTETKRNTLTPNSQEVMRKLDGGMTITTYVNLLDKDYYFGLPEQVNADKERFKQYLRFKPEIKMKYVYYYDSTDNAWLDIRFPNTTVKEKAMKLADIRNLDFKMFMSPEELKKEIDLTDEGNRFVRVVERKNGQKAFLRLFNDVEKFPSEAEIAVTFKRFVMKLPKVGFLTGHGERSMSSERARGYLLFSQLKNYRYSLINQGFDIEEVSLAGDSDIPQDMEIVVIADIQEKLSPDEQLKLERYIERGGNLLITGEPKNREAVNHLLAPLGVQFVPGTLVQKRQDILPNVMIAEAAPKAKELSYFFDNMMFFRPGRIVMDGAAGLAYTQDKGFHVEEVLRADTVECWNELETTDFVNDSVCFNPSVGESAQRYPVALALTRQVNGREQRIMVLGDADCISNDEFSIRRNLPFLTVNYTLVTGTFSWLSYNEAPIDVRRPGSSDNKIHLSRKSMPAIKAVFLGVIPTILLLWGIIIWVRRKQR